jgi:hypothetical protein
MIKASFSRTFAALLCATAALASATHASADTLYTNGAVNGTSNALSINNFDTVRDTFTLTGDSTITEVDFGAWTSHGNTLETVGWEIVDPTVTTVYAGGNANVSATVLFTNSFNFDVDQASFDISPLNLGPGTYVLGLYDIGTATGGATYWDENGGPSSAETAPSPLAAGSPVSSSESFQIVGTSQAVTPEPSPVAGLILGGLLAGLLVWRRKVSA